MVGLPLRMQCGPGLGASGTALGLPPSHARDGRNDRATINCFFFSKWSDGEVIAARFLGSGVQVASRGRQRRMTERFAHGGEVRAAA